MDTDFRFAGIITPTESNPSEEGVEGWFELDLAGAQRLLGKIMVSQDATFFCFGENWWSYFLERYQLLRTST
jgi:hypothetical protein